MYNCFDVAKHILEMAREEGQLVDPMKLLKITYIAHGFYLGIKQKPLFENNIQAWQYGAVIPDLYHVIKRFGMGSVDKDIVGLYSNKELSEEDAKFVTSIWKHYKKYTGMQLSELTHAKDSPWEKSYVSGRNNLIISNDVIKSYYTDLVNNARNGK